MKTLSEDFACCSSPHEIGLMLCWAGSSISARTVERIQVLIRSEIYWDILFNQAKHHGILSLLHKNLDEAATELVPELVPDSVMYQL